MWLNIHFLVGALFFVAILEVVELAIDERLKDDFFHIYKNAAVETRDIQNKPVTEDQVTFYLYTNENPKDFTGIDTNNLERFKNTTNQIVFLIHGWTNSRETEWMEDLKNAFLIRDKESFVIIVDWKEPANQFYYVSSINTFDVADLARQIMDPDDTELLSCIIYDIGWKTALCSLVYGSYKNLYFTKFVTKLLTNLYKNYGVDKGNFLLVGHSLGGQICGFVGKQFKKETLESLPRIIALDPAGPLFTSRPIDKRLNKDDAEVVEVIHTDGGTFGFQDACGTIDFFVNGGSTQPGCKQIDLADLLGTFQEPLMCDHRRAWAYFIEAVLNPTDLVAQKCSSWAQYKVNYCDKETVAMGDLTTTLTGTFYLDTNKEKPYSRKLSKGLSLSRLLN